MGWRGESDGAGTGRRIVVVRTPHTDCCLLISLAYLPHTHTHTQVGIILHNLSIVMQQLGQDGTGRDGMGREVKELPAYLTIPYDTPLVNASITPIQYTYTT